jgi:cell pole-organizing protein PopZ
MLNGNLTTALQTRFAVIRRPVEGNLADIDEDDAGMTQPAKASGPSMEEILASIRRIIADDDTAKSAQPEPEASGIAAPVLKPAAAPRPVEPPPPAAARDLFEAQTADILELTEEVSAALPPAASPPAAPRVAPIPHFRRTDGACDVGSADVVEKIAARRKPDEAQLLSRETSAAVDSAFNTLTQAVLVRNPRTLEDLVREMLRPMLKSWLDENLPTLVERLVRAEIERVSRGH